MFLYIFVVHFLVYHNDSTAQRSAFLSATRWACKAVSTSSYQRLTGSIPFPEWIQIKPYPADLSKHARMHYLSSYSPFFHSQLLSLSHTHALWLPWWAVITPNRVSASAPLTSDLPISSPPPPLRPSYHYTTEWMCAPSPETSKLAAQRATEWELERERERCAENWERERDGKNKWLTKRRKKRDAGIDLILGYGSK